MGFILQIKKVKKYLKKVPQIKKMYYLCITKQKETLTNKTQKNMEQYLEMNDAEILKIFNNALNIESIEEKESKRRSRVRKSKADFCNLNEKTINEVVFI